MKGSKFILSFKVARITSILVLLLTFLCPWNQLNSQVNEFKKHQIHIDAGIYSLHGSGFRNPIIEVHYSRKASNHFLIDYCLKVGLPSGNIDGLIAYEMGFEYQFKPFAKINPYISAGAGLMLEGSLSGQGYIAFGMYGKISENQFIRFAILRSNHINFGDSGTFKGPHSITLGWGKSF